MKLFAKVAGLALAGSLASSLAGSLAAAPALADRAQFKLINQSGYTLVRFYSSAASADNWGRDIFGDQLLESGYSTYVTIPGNQTQCLYDFRLVFSDDDILYDTVDLCDVGQYTIN